ncbi:hypothetical protein ABK040_013140 [Willaertia magna]
MRNQLIKNLISKRQFSVALFVRSPVPSSGGKDTVNSKEWKANDRTDTENKDFNKQASSNKKVNENKQSSPTLETNWREMLSKNIDNLEDK